MRGLIGIKGAPAKKIHETRRDERNRNDQQSHDQDQFDKRERFFSRYNIASLKRYNGRERFPLRHCNAVTI